MPLKPVFQFVLRFVQQLGWFYVLTLGTAAFALGTFGELAEEVLERELAGVNEAVLWWIHGHTGPVLDAVMLGLTMVGSAPGILVIGALFGAWLIQRRVYLDATVLVMVLGGGGILTYTLKQIFIQPRPRLFPQLVTEMSYSFPSGHSLMSFCLFGFIAWWLTYRSPLEAWRWAWGFAAVLLAALIAFSRLYLGVHWPTDVLAGAIVAIFWLSICLAGRHWFASREPRLSNGPADPVLPG